MAKLQSDKILEIGIQLAAEHDYDALLSRIIDCAMEVTYCDGGTLYLYEEDQLNFCIMKNKSLGINRDGKSGEQYPPVPMDEKNVCAYAAIHRKLLNIEDAYDCGEFDFSGPREYDKLTGYRTKSILVFPLVNHEDKLVGVVQLINAMDEQGRVIPFGEECEKVVQSLGSQAAVAVSNMRFVQEIEQLMISITQVFTDAIDARIPYNYYHSRNVHFYTKMLVDHINRQHARGLTDRSFSFMDRDELLMAALMHDIGKLVIPNEVIDKSSRLGSKLPLVLERFGHLTALYQIDYLEGRVDREKWEDFQNTLVKAGQRIKELNKKEHLSDEEIAYVQQLAECAYTNSSGQTIPFLTLEEKECLTIPTGNLTGTEREIIKSHVDYTIKYLHKMNFDKRYPHIIQWAGAHHEFLDGSGYPKGLKGDEIPFEARILVVVDVFEALTSSDRPYKKPMEQQKALNVLTEMADKGKVDREVLDLFQEALVENADQIQLMHH